VCQRKRERLATAFHLMLRVSVCGPLFVCLHGMAVRHTNNFIIEPFIWKRDHVQRLKGKNVPPSE